MIVCVDSLYTAEYIANIFWNQHIATLNNLTLIPYLKENKIHFVAYINIDQWCDSEAAYNFIQRLKSPSREARIIYNDDNWWSVELNTHNNGNLEVGSYTTWFSSNYFKKEIATAPCSDDENDLCSVDVDAQYCRQDFFSEDYPIRGLQNYYYSVEEAQEVIDCNKYILTEWREMLNGDIDAQKKETEITHFEQELAIHKALSQSQNVTAREKPKCDSNRVLCDFKWENLKSSNVKCS